MSTKDKAHKAVGLKQAWGVGVRSRSPHMAGRITVVFRGKPKKERARIGCGPVMKTVGDLYLCCFDAISGVLRKSDSGGQDAEVTLERDEDLFGDRRR